MKPLCEVYECKDRAYRRLWFESTSYIAGRRLSYGFNFCGTHLKRRESLIFVLPVVGSMHIEDWLERQ